MTTLKFAIRSLKRDWRAGELRILVGAIIIAVTCVTAVGFFTDRIALALSTQASELLGADLRIAADHPITESILNFARQSQLNTVTTLSFRSMVFHQKWNHLAEIKAVGETYPLRGTLRISQDRLLAGEPTSAVPAPGTVWVEAEILSKLHLNIGDNLNLGESIFKIVAILTYEPDRSGDMFSIAPRVMLNALDIPATKLVQEGSRIQYRLLVAGESQNVAKFRARIESKLLPGESIESVEDARKEVRFALERAQQFLGLAALVSVILTCVAIAMAARRYAERHLDTCAILRCVGAAQGQITRLYLIQLLILGVSASIIGCFLGYAGQQVLANLLGNLVVISLPSASWTPVFSGLAIGLIGLVGFAVPPILRLKHVPTLRVLRRDLGAMPPVTTSSYLFGLCLLAGLLVWQAGDLELGIYILVGLIGSVFTLVLFAKTLILILKKLPRGNSLAWRFGIDNITRQPASSTTQVLAFGIGIMVLLLLTLVRGDILSTWANNLPADASNRFVINILPDQVPAVLKYFSQQGMSNIQLYPMVRARLKFINDSVVESNRYPSQRAKNLVRREFNLSWSNKLQSDNKIVAGKWWTEANSDSAQLSIEQGLAKTLGIGIGDTLVFNIAGEDIKATVTNLRNVQWDTFKPNFFVLTPPKTLEGYPASYITSFYLDKSDLTVLNNLVKSFPNLTIIDISAIMNQIRTIIDRVSLAVEYVFLFTLLAGLMVLYAAIQTTRDERVRENAILRAIGAGRSRLIKSMVTEFSVIGALAGFVAAISASLLAYFITEHLFKLTYSFNPWIIVIGLSAGILGIGLAGSLSTRSVLSKPPIQVLREN